MNRAEDLQLFVSALLDFDLGSCYTILTRFRVQKC